MRNKRRADIILDFTSLLDVTLLILFFFIMFSSFKNEEALDRADEKVAYAEEMMKKAEEKAERFEESAQNAEIEIEELHEEIDTIKSIYIKSGKFAESIEEYKKGGNVKIIYSVDDTVWKLEILLGTETIATINRKDYENNKEREWYKNTLVDALKDHPVGDYFFCETIICSPKYNGFNNVYGSIIKEAENKYGKDHFIISETDLSKKDFGG